MGLSGMGEQDIRGMASYGSYRKRLDTVKICMSEEGDHPEEIRLLALAKAFSLTLMLGERLLKDYLEHQGVYNVGFSKEVIRKAVTAGIMTEADAQVWIDAFDAISKLEHAHSKCGYQAAMSRELARDIEQAFLPVFESL